MEVSKGVGIESSGVSVGFHGYTDLIGSERSGIGVKLVLLPDESHYSSGCGIWPVRSWSSELSGKMGSNFLFFLS